MSYGARYDFSNNTLIEAPPIAPFLHPLRLRIADWAGIAAESFSHAIVTEYRAGTPLGWHRDIHHFETVVGVSLASPARMRLRRYPPQRGDRAATNLELEPRSIYSMQAAARWDWQHAISPTHALRYSITFRTLRGARGESSG